MKFLVYFGNEQTDNEYTLTFETGHSAIAEKWGNTLESQIRVSNTICEPDRMYNFPDNEWDDAKMVSELNVCIDIINTDQQMIEQRAWDNMGQHGLNILHHYFENLRGGVATPSDFWVKSDTKVKSALERFNIIIHRYEGFISSQNTGKPPMPRIVCRFHGGVRIPLEDEDYDHFTMTKTFGEVQINYCEVGKPLYDVYKDQDDIIGEDNIRPLRFYSCDFTVAFHEHTQVTADKFLKGMKTWWDQNASHLSALGFQHNDKKNAIGLIPVANMVTPHDTEHLKSDIINNLSIYNQMKRVEILDE